LFGNFGHSSIDGIIIVIDVY